MKIAVSQLFSISLLWVSDPGPFVLMPCLQMKWRLIYLASHEQDVPVQSQVGMKCHMGVGTVLRHDLTKGITICNNKQPLSVGAIIWKCQSNYSLAWLIVHKVIKERGCPISQFRQNATKPASSLGGAAWKPGFVGRCSFCSLTGSFIQKVITWMDQQTYICSSSAFFFAYFLFILHPSK